MIFKRLVRLCKIFSDLSSGLLQRVRLADVQPDQRLLRDEERLQHDGDRPLQQRQHLRGEAGHVQHLAAEVRRGLLMLRELQRGTE